MPRPMNTIFINAVGDSFLYKMVRGLTGYLAHVGFGYATPEDAIRVMNAADRREAADSAPAKGLFLAKVFWSADEWNVDIPLIISNHEDLRPIAEKFGIAYHVFPITKENKAQQEAAELELLKKNGVTFIVLARYMQVMSGDFCKRWHNRCINIHHGFLPAFRGAKPYHQAWNKGVKIIGATGHLPQRHLKLFFISLVGMADYIYM